MLVNVSMKMPHERRFEANNSHESSLYLFVIVNCSNNQYLEIDFGRREHNPGGIRSHEMIISQY
jgi:hypothetical protein